MKTIERIKEIIAVHSCDISGKPERIADDALFADVISDSLDRLEALMAIEDHYRIEITDGEADECKTVKDIANLVDRLTGHE
jgi:acyl carrier protein